MDDLLIKYAERIGALKGCVSVAIAVLDGSPDIITQVVVDQLKKAYEADQIAGGFIADEKTD